MLVNLREILKKADSGRYAIGGFNITSLESAMAIVEASQEEHSAVILQISEKTVEYISLDLAFTLAKTLADNSPMPVSVHFDHGKNFPLVQKAIDLGMPSVMLDVSKMAVDERINFVREFVDRAHKKNVTVEAEEDVIGGIEDYVEGKGWKFTDPKRAVSFVEQTGIDCFAVSIGSSHGKPLPHETLDIELLSRIDQVVSVPLVLHGASQTPPELIRQAIAHGVCKINIDTELRLAFTKGIRQALKDKDIYDPREELAVAKEAIKQKVQEDMRLFGSSGKY